MSKKNSRKLKKKDVLNLAKLSQLQLSDEEMNKIGSQLNETLSYVANLSELPTDTVSSKDSHVTNTTNIYSEDIVDESRILSQEEAMGNAHKRSNNYFVVSRIL